MHRWDDEQMTLTEQDGLVPVRKMYRIFMANFRRASPNDFEQSSVQRFPISCLSAFRCMCALYTTAVIVVSCFHYRARNWSSWLPLAIQICTGIYFLLAGILSQVHYLILVCLKGTCAGSKRLSVTGSDDMTSEGTGVENNNGERDSGENGHYCASEQMHHFGVALIEERHNVETLGSGLTMFHQIFWIFADITPCLSLVLTVTLIDGDHTLLHHSKDNIINWYVVVNIYLLCTVMLTIDFILSKIPKRISRLILPLLFSFGFGMVTRFFATDTKSSRQWLPPLNCQSRQCSYRQEMYIIIGVPVAYCMLLLLDVIKDVLSLRRRRAKLKARWV